MINLKKGYIEAHDELEGLSDDDHSQYALLTGRDGESLAIDEIKAYDGAGLKLYDDNDNGIFVEDGGNVGIGTDNPTYKLDVVGDIGINEYLYHNGDANTYIRYQTDQIDFVAGGEVLLKLFEGGQDYVKLGDGGDVDINLNGDIVIDAGLSTVIFNVAPTFKNDITIGNGVSITRGVFTISKKVNFFEGSPVTCAVVDDNYMVIDVYVEVVTTWDDVASTFSIGDSNNASGFIANANINLQVAGWYGTDIATRGAYLWDGTSSQRKIYTGGDTVDATFNAEESHMGQCIVHTVIQKLA